MYPTFHAKHRRLQTSLDGLLRQLENYSEQQLKAQPVPGAWSALQVMQHLMVAEKLSVLSIQRRIDKGMNFRKTNLQSWSREVLLAFSLRIPLKFKAPTAVADELFSADATFATVSAEWSAARNDLAEFLGKLPSELARKQIYRHPRGGWMSAVGMLDFFIVHFDRHCKQIERTLKLSL
ncbi:MAG: DinB family protein [Bacteroidota bacterium]